ncbi:MAG: serine/threonine-protein phosphatase [Actinomycetota bacterium]|nr:serine/threonine-protein phosphatase [Actinomycetota bacterium]
MGKGAGRWTATAIALVVAVAGLDIVIAGGGFGGLLVAGPVVASFRLSPRRTAAIAALAVAAGVIVAGVDGRLDELNEVIRLVGIAVVGGMCVLGALWQERRERAFQQVTRVAEAAQRAILRPIPSRVGPVALASRYLSAAEQALIGGDLYEVVATPAGARAVVGDVRGKGLDAVQLAAAVLAAFRESAMAEGSLIDVAAAVDRAVTTTITPEDFVTAVFVDFGRQGQVEVLNCGHHPPLHITPAAVGLLGAEVTYPPLGLSPTFTSYTYRLARGDRLLLYTDGLVEARSSDGAFFPLEQEAAALLTRRSLETAVAALVACVLDHAGGHLDDDLAVVLAEIRG